ncbi:phage holin family protein [Clostridiaceae bacterium M8S5]|nr:phage holin family protein [Clostridiaceae bacterium M8S5]
MKEMMLEIIDCGSNIFKLCFSKSIWILGSILGIILSEIGYPKEVLIFIVTLIVIDLLSKQYSIIIKNYGKFTISLFYKGWKDKHLTSRALKNGICVKVFLYLPVLYTAHKCSILFEVVYGKTISNILYTVLVLVELTSILENCIDSGFTNLKPILKFLKHKQDNIVSDNNKDD